MVRLGQLRQPPLKDGAVAPQGIRAAQQRREELKLHRQHGLVPECLIHGQPFAQRQGQLQNSEYEVADYPARGGSGGRRRDGRVVTSGGRAAGRSSRAASASRTAVSSWVSRSAAQSAGLISTSTSGSTP